MPLENATSIAELNPAYPLASDAVASADDHIRLIKQVLKNTFASLNLSDLTSRSVPTGIVAMWSGAANAIPAGWFLCDGTNTTPDLRDRFVVGAGTSYSVGSKGGAVNTVTTTTGSHLHSIGNSGAHTHTGTVEGHTLTVDEIPSHNHVAPWGESNTTDAPYGASSSAGKAGSGETDHDNYNWNTSSTGGGRAHAHGLTVDQGGDHSHSLTAAGDHNHTVDTRSPYYALCFIMKG